MSQSLLAGAASVGETGTKTYVEDVFSTYLYYGTGGTAYPKPINNGIKLGDGPTDGTVLHLRADASSGGTNSTFVDSSTNNFTVTRSGTVAQGSFSPFGTVGGSAYFSGTSGQQLSVADNAAHELGSSDFTFECWVYLRGDGYAVLYNKAGSSSSTSGIEIYVAARAINVFATAGSSWDVQLYTSAILRINAWEHVAVTRSGSTWTIWVNGESIGTTTASITINNNTNAVVVGRFTDGFEGRFYLSNLRMVKGTALYSSSFTPSTTPLTAVSGTTLLLSCDNANIIDSAPLPNGLNLSGSPVVNNSTYKYGTGSLYFDGSSGVQVPNTPGRFSFDPSTDFTMECWLYPTSVSGTTYRQFLTKGVGNVGDWGLSIYDSKIRFGTTVIEFTSTNTISANTWTHIALAREGNLTRLFINGTLDTELVLEENNLAIEDPAYSNSVWVGAGNDGGGNYYTGYIDDIRITKGTARYTASFTPPSSLLPLDTLEVGSGGLVWLKRRGLSGNNENHGLFDTERRKGYYLFTNTTGAEDFAIGVSDYNNKGFTLGYTGANWNSADYYASWTFRKAPKFFDIVTYTGNGSSSKIVSHSLESTPGCIIIKRLDSTGSWWVFHRNPNSEGSYWTANLDATTGAGGPAGIPSISINSFDVADMSYQAATNYTATNSNGARYVAYIFAHNAGGFGESGEENVISCGMFLPDGSGNASVDLGYEPQWLMVFDTNGGDNWRTYDTARGWGLKSRLLLNPNSSSYESSLSNEASGYDNIPNSTGFSVTGHNPTNHIYIAIRRGPMRTPTRARDVFGIHYDTTFNAGQLKDGPDVVDLFWAKQPSAINYARFADRVRGVNYGGNAIMYPSQTNANNDEDYWRLDVQGGVGVASSIGTIDYIHYMFRRAPGFMDIVGYTGTGVARTISHNLGVTPELIISKKTTTTSSWFVVAPGPLPYGYAGTGATSSELPFMYLNTTDQAANASGISAVSSTSFSVTTSTIVNQSSVGYITYMFASIAGVSKIDKYTGTGSDVNVDCGFSNGAKMVLIKRVDNSGDWYLYDWQRGIVAGNDPYLLLNSGGAENTSYDYIDPYSAGFTITSAAPAGLNANGGVYLYLAIA